VNVNVTRYSEGTLIADGTPEISMSPLTLEHLFHCGIKAFKFFIEENGVTCLQSDGNRLLHVDVCKKLFASQVLLTEFKEMKIILREIETIGRVVYNSQSRTAINSHKTGC
jgi:hypothetical protein